MQRHHVHGVSGDEGNVGTTVEKNFCSLLLSEEAGEVERAEAIHRAGGDQGGVGGEQLGEALRVSGGGRFKDVEAGLGGEEQLEDFGLTMIERQHDGGDSLLVGSGGQGCILCKQVADWLNLSGLNGGDEGGWAVHRNPQSFFAIS